MKRLLLVINDLHVAGIERAAVDLLNQIATNQDWEITLYLVRKQGAFIRELPGNIRVLEIPMPEFVRLEAYVGAKVAFKYCLKKGRFIQATRILKHHFKEKKLSFAERMRRFWRRTLMDVPACPDAFDVAIDFQGQGAFPTFYIKDKVQAKRKYTWVHSDFTRVGYSLQWLFPIFAAYDGIVAVSQAAERAFWRVFPDLRARTTVCYNAMNVPKILAAAQESVEKGPGINIVTVGRIVFLKGYDLALAALKRLQLDGVTFTYWIVGDGEDRGAIQALVCQEGLQRHVRFVGSQNNPYKFMNICDIYLQPSKFEGFCLTLGEAKLLRKCIVTTDFAGAREQITDQHDGLIVPPEADAIYSALKRLIVNPKLRETFVCRLQSTYHDDGLRQFYRLIDQ